MKTRNLIMMIFALGWLILSGCKETKVGWHIDQDFLLERIPEEMISCEPHYFHFHVYFPWYIENPKAGVTYNYSILLNGKRYIHGFEKRKRKDIYVSLRDGIKRSLIFNAIDNITYPVVHKTGSYTLDCRDSLRPWWGKSVSCVIRVETPIGRVYESAPRTIICDNTELILDYPPCGASLGENITFQWHIKNPREGQTYNSTIFFDKGMNPFDGWYEMSADVGKATEYTKDCWGYYEWGVKVKSSDGTIYSATGSINSCNKNY